MTNDNTHPRTPTARCAEARTLAPAHTQHNHIKKMANVKHFIHTLSVNENRDQSYNALFY